MLESIFNWLTVTYPPVGVGLMVLGAAFVLCELLVKATPTDKDDKFLARITNGYLGVVWRAIKRRAPRG